MKGDQPGNKSQLPVISRRARMRLDGDSDQTAADADQTAADADQTAADADQTAADADQTAADAERSYAEADQRASDRDQVTADRDRKAHFEPGLDVPEEYEISRLERQAGTVSRFLTLSDRNRSAYTRTETAFRRDETGAARDESALRRDDRERMMERDIATSDAPLAEKLDRVRRLSAAYRARAAADRRRAAQERAEAAEERARLQSELDRAHLDDLTGAYRREVGNLALSHEVDRARRSDGRFVLAFVDVDDLKVVNDSDGHAAGDRVLQIVVTTIRSKLRSFDPVVRSGGDEFVCGLGGTDLEEARRRFDSIAIDVSKAASVGISVGLAELEEGETPDQLTARADAALLEAKRNRHQTS